MADVMRWIKTQEEFEVRALLQNTGLDFAIHAAESAWQREDRARSSVYTTLESALRAFDYVESGVGLGPFIDIDRFLSAPADTLYLTAPPDEQEEYQPLFTGLTRTVIREVYLRNQSAHDHRSGEDQDQTGLIADQGCRLLLLLDEAGNIARLENLSTLATTAAGTSVQLISIFHDISQIEALYGRYEAQSIVNNHSALMVLPGTRDISTLSYLESLLKGERIGYSSDAQWTGPRPIRSMNRGEALLIYENLRPILINLRTKFNDDDIRAKVVM